jgi:hypothetical protein
MELVSYLGNSNWDFPFLVPVLLKVNGCQF